MGNQFNIRTILSQHPIIPVVNITDVSKVESIIETLESKSINCIEITLRSDVAFEAIEKAVSIKPEGFQIGVGTIINAKQIATCIDLNVDFMVSPGVSENIAEAFNSSNLPFLPGVMTPSEIIKGVEKGWDTFKLFPFNLAGGVKALNTYGNVFEQVKFCPTGGINENNYQECLELNNVISVGGSWVLS